MIQNDTDNRNGIRINHGAVLYRFRYGNPEED